MTLKYSDPKRKKFSLGSCKHLGRQSRAGEVSGIRAPFHLGLCCQNDNGQSLLASYPTCKKSEEGQEDTPVPYKGMLPLASAYIFLTRVGHMALLAARGIKTSGFSWMVIQSTAMDWMCPLQNVCIEALALSVTV